MSSFNSNLLNILVAVGDFQEYLGEEIDLLVVNNKSIKFRWVCSSSEEIVRFSSLDEMEEELKIKAKKHTLVCFLTARSKAFRKWKELIPKESRLRFRFLGINKDDFSKLVLKDNKCGEVFEITFNSFIKSGFSCPKCCKDRRYPYSKSEINRILSQRYGATRFTCITLERVEFSSGVAQNRYTLKCHCGGRFKVYHPQFMAETFICPKCNEEIKGR